MSQCKNCAKELEYHDANNCVKCEGLLCNNCAYPNDVDMPICNECIKGSYIDFYFENLDYFSHKNRVLFAHLMVGELYSEVKKIADDVETTKKRFIRDRLNEKATVNKEV